MSDNLEGLHAAAEDILGALESKDATALVSALHSFIEICESSGDEEDEEDGYSKGGPVWDDEGSIDDFAPLTAQRKQSEYIGERYKR